MKTIKKRIARKLKSRAGESLGEVLIALLIAALALTMLAAVISSSSKIITQSKKKMADYNTANEVLAAQETETKKLNITIKRTTGESEPFTSTGSAIALTPGQTTNGIFYAENEVAGKPVISYWR